MSEERKKAGVWPWIVALLVELPALYVASFGPTCAFVERDVWPTSALDLPVFKPCLALATDAPEPVRKVIFVWVEFCGGSFVLAEFITRKEFELAPYRGISGGLFR